MPREIRHMSWAFMRLRHILFWLVLVVASLLTGHQSCKFVLAWPTYFFNERHLCSSFCLSRRLLLTHPPNFSDLLWGDFQQKVHRMSQRYPSKSIQQASPISLSRLDGSEQTQLRPLKTFAALSVSLRCSFQYLCLVSLWQVPLHKLGSRLKSSGRIEYGLLCGQYSVPDFDP